MKMMRNLINPDPAHERKNPVLLERNEKGLNLGLGTAVEDPVKETEKVVLEEMIETIGEAVPGVEERLTCGDMINMMRLMLMVVDVDVIEAVVTETERVVQAVMMIIDIMKDIEMKVILGKNIVQSNCSLNCCTDSNGS